VYSVCEEFPGAERDIIYFIYLTFFNLGELCAKTDRERGQTLLGMGVAQLGTG
jgi:hypothetical protein